MKKSNVLVMLVLVVLCAAGFYFLKDRAGTSPSRLPAFWPAVAKSDVQTLTMRGQGNELRLRRREGMSDRWDEIVGVELLRADANKIDDFLTAFASESVTEKIPRETVDAAKVAAFGLDKPLLEVEAGIPGKTAVLVRYGKISGGGGKIYADSGPGTDVWVVNKDAMELALSALSGGAMRGTRLFDEGLFDVAEVEILKDGVTWSQVVRDAQQIWRFKQPFKGYANVEKFENLVCAPIVNVKVGNWEDVGAPDLAKYGLAKPQYEVRVTRKGEGKKPEVVFASPSGSGGSFVMEAGTKSVASVGKPFLEALTLAANDYRDTAFTRLGADGTAVQVQLKGTMPYKLEKAGSTFDVVMGPERRPASGDKVLKLLDRIRSWSTVEFLDGHDPEEFGISDEQFVEIDLNAAGRDAPGKLVLRFGDLDKRPDDKTVYGQRRGDGGVERVEGGPLYEMLRGPQQYFRGTAFAWTPEWVFRLTRNPGYGDEGTKVQVFTIERDNASAPWASTGPGIAGELDGQAISDLLASVREVKEVEWIPYDSPKDNERMGFKPPLAETMTIEAHIGNTVDVKDPTSVDPKIYVGKRRPEGGYYARKSDDRNWAFVLKDEIVEKLKREIAPTVAKQK